MVENSTGHPGLDTNRPPFDFFYQIIIQMRSVILEDRTVYAKFLPKFVQLNITLWLNFKAHLLFGDRYCKVNFGDISAVELWHLFSTTIEGLFDEEANLELFTPNEYLTLLFTVN